MEILDGIKGFVSYHKVYGNGNGYGNGYGNGDGNGNGNGYGNGYGYGDGNGNGYGNGDGIKQITINNKTHKVFKIDNTQTIILSIKRNIAIGYILNKDLTLKDCYITKKDNLFAHGSSVKQALESLNEKLFNSLTIEERINNFKDEFKDYSKKHKAKVLFKWHGILTQSCEFGRKSFCVDNDINIEKDELTINEFITLTKEAYQGNIIKQLIKN